MMFIYSLSYHDRLELVNDAIKEDQRDTKLKSKAHKQVSEYCINVIKWVWSM